MKACLVLAGLWLLGVAVVVVYFHAIGRPLDSVICAFLFSPGIGELGFSSLIKAAKEKSGAEAAEAQIAALQAELDAAKAKPPKTTAASREQKQARSMLEQMLPSLIVEAEKAYGAGAGALKLSFVLEKVYARLPDACRMLFTVDQLGGMIDKALAIAKELWARNPELIGGKP